SLYVAKNNQPGDVFSGQPALTQRKIGKASFPSLEYNDVPASLAVDETAAYSFVAFVRGQPASNVWLHTGGKPALAGHEEKPTGYASPNPTALDSRIQVVFPHDERGQPAPAKSATRLNVAIDIFQHDTTLSVPPDAEYTPE